MTVQYRKPWVIGDTTCKNPHNLRKALAVVRDSDLNGDVLGDKKRHFFARRLHEEKVVSYEKVRPLHFEGRKWLLALSRMGFMTSPMAKEPAIKKCDGVDLLLSDIVSDAESDFSGRPHEITPAGHAFLNAKSSLEQEICILRSIVGQRRVIDESGAVSFPIDRGNKSSCDMRDVNERFKSNFSPLHFLFSTFSMRSCLAAKRLASPRRSLPSLFRRQFPQMELVPLWTGSLTIVERWRSWNGPWQEPRRARAF